LDCLCPEWLTTILGADEAVGWVAEDAEAVAAAARG
jgi:hypothetical protein